jgi:hypothetical protein
MFVPRRGRLSLQRLAMDISMALLREAFTSYATAVSPSLTQARYAVVLHAKQCQSSWLSYAKPSQLCHSCFSKPNTSSVRSSVACEAAGSPMRSLHSYATPIMPYLGKPSKPRYASNLSRAVAGFLTRSPSVVLHANIVVASSHMRSRHSYATLPLGTAVPAPDPGVVHYELLLQA